ncbi:MAG: penicillin-binding protein 2 [Clostridia bacterium]|nr:penicillin-binding protein 2 [Clostridia bacterium]
MYKRSAYLFFLLCFVLGIMCTRLALIGQGLVQSAAGMSNSVSVTADSSRGMIYDRNMKPLVNSERKKYIAVKPDVQAYEENKKYIPEAERQLVFEEISSGRIGISEAVNAADNEENLLFEKLIRYPSEGFCAHLIGYTDSSGHGVSGLEKYYDEILSRNGGSIKIICSVDARRNPLKGEKMKYESDGYASAAGISVTIDTDAQTVAEKAAAQYGLDRGAIVILTVDSSEILALVSTPCFDRNNIAESLEDPSSPFVNRAVTPYSVGSVFKAAVACAAVESGVPEGLLYNCTGEYTIGENSFGCHKKDGHGELDMQGAMTVSCNPYFINLAETVGKESICETGRKLGLGKRIELCDGWYTPSGIMPDEAELVSRQDLANLAFGQGRLLASPLQMAALYAAIANEGVYRRPSLMKGIINENGETVMAAELPAPRRVMKKETAEAVGRMLFATVNDGSSGKAKPESKTAAGKTATAQSGQFKENGEEIIRSWFCGYFPYESPKYAVAILKEDGRGGTADCAPIFKYIADNLE